MVTAAFGQILSAENLSIPKYGCINVHGSLLPKYRGAAPIQWSIIEGEKITGVTTMLTDVGLDTGDMLLRREVEIGENETAGELFDQACGNRRGASQRDYRMLRKGRAKAHKAGRSSRHQMRHDKKRGRQDRLQQAGPEDTRSGQGNESMGLLPLQCWMVSPSKYGPPA